MSENPTRRSGVGARWRAWQLAPDGKPRPDAPFARGPLAARVLAAVIDGAAWVGSRTPARVAHRLAVFGGTIEWVTRPALRHRLATNLAHAVDSTPRDRNVCRLVRHEILNEARRSADLLWSLGQPDEFRGSVVIEGAENGVRALEGGNGMILAGLHLGGWDIASLWGALHAFGGTPIAALPLAYTTGYLAQSVPVPFVATGGMDAATTFALSAVGVPLHIGLAAVIAHRVFAFWVPVLPGLVLAATLPRRFEGGDEPSEPGVVSSPRDRTGRQAPS